MSATASGRYALPIQALHWFTALAIVAAWVLAMVFDGMPRGPEKAQLIWLHKSLGVTVLLVTAIRLVLRHIAPPQHRERVRLLLDFAPETGHRSVPDPYYGGPEGFELVLDLVEAASRGLLAHLRQVG